MAKEVSVLVGGKAGDGINNAGAMVARMFGHLGYHVFMYYDYPSLIRGGHNFALVRASDQPVTVHQDRADVILALDQETVDLHQSHCPGCTLVINSDRVKPVDGALGVSLKSLLAAEAAPPIMGNSAMLGAFAKTAGIPWETVESVFFAHMPKAEQNLKIARRAYDLVQTVRPVEPLHRAAFPLLTGNEAVGLGLVRGGLAAYVSYPMTPSSSILHFLAEQKDRFCLKVVHPENEIAVILMALGFAYAGARTAVGTSGGGFCLMTEGLSFAGMAEFPVVIVMSQRTGPSTGLPTYSGQADLHFVRSAGQGEFPGLLSRLVMLMKHMPGQKLPWTVPGNTRSLRLSLSIKCCPKAPIVSPGIPSITKLPLTLSAGTLRCRMPGTAIPRTGSPRLLFPDERSDCEGKQLRSR